MNLHDLSLAHEAEPAPGIGVDERAEELRDDRITHLDAIDDEAFFNDVDADGKVI